MNKNGKRKKRVRKTRENYGNGKKERMKTRRKKGKLKGKEEGEII